MSLKNDSCRILVATATYNEITNIENLLNIIKAECPSADILIVDDNSPDGTGNLLDTLSGHDNRIKLIRRPAKLGLGSAHLLAMVYAIRHGYEFLVTMDADHSHDPRSIKNLLNNLANSDFVIGSRYMTGGKSDYHGYRKYISQGANFLARLLLNIPIHEFTTSFRAFRVSKLRELDLSKFNNNGYSFFMETIYRFKQAKFRISESPIYFHDRFSGTSKIPKFEIINGFATLVRLSGSNIFKRKIGENSSSTLEKDTCIDCNSYLLVEKFVGNSTGNYMNAKQEDFKCTSMSHNLKPLVAVCTRCGLSQIPKSAQEKFIAELYKNVIDNSYLENIKAKEKTFAYAFKQLSPFIKPKSTMLEIGSYCGLFLNEARSHGVIAQGIEPSNWACKYSRSHFDVSVVQGTFEEVYPSINSKFEVIASWDVIEHVSNPRAFIQNSFNLLVKNGIFTISTIDIDSRFAKLMSGQWPWIMSMHLHYFGRGSLERMLIESGFAIESIKPHKHYASTRYAFEKFCLSLPSKIGKFLMVMKPLVPNLIIPFSFGDVKVYIARKL